jgi:GNAT superfamily N-acetyltransferase
MAERTRLVSLSVAAWRPVWGITPPRETEISYALNSLFRWRPAVMAAMAEEAGEPVGAALAVPDAIPLLSGWPAGRKPRCMRVFPAWVLPKRPGQGIEALLYGRLIEAIAGRGYRYAEFAPFASDDEAAAAVLSGLGARKGKRYRGYEKRFALDS